jgi:hypothetical protein
MYINGGENIGALLQEDGPKGPTIRPTITDKKMK